MESVSCLSSQTAIVAGGGERLRTRHGMWSSGGFSHGCRFGLCAVNMNDCAWSAGVLRVALAGLVLKPERWERSCRIRVSVVVIKVASIAGQRS